MAAVQWSGGKMHGSVEAKASMLHDDKVMRLHHSHSNPDIDLSKTKQNFSLWGLTYAQKCERYDALMENVKIKRKSSGKNANVTLQKLVIPIPAGMQHDDNIDMQMFRQWTADVGQILKDLYGDLLIDLDAHVDEVHLYLDSRKDEKDGSRYTWSRAHLHAAIVPAVWEPVKGADSKPMKDETGKPVRELCLNSTKFSNKRNIIRLNNRIQEMTQQKYHMLFMDGTGVGKKHNTVEEMKALSAEELRDAGYQIVSDKAEIEKARIQLKAAEEELKSKRKAFFDEMDNDATLRDMLLHDIRVRQKKILEAEKQIEAESEPEKIVERAASVVLKMKGMSKNLKLQNACMEVLNGLSAAKKVPHVLKEITKPTADTWKDVAAQQKENIHQMEQRIFQSILCSEISANGFEDMLDDEDESERRTGRFM